MARVLKILIIGEACSGKTSIVDRFIDNNFHNNSSSTIGVDFRTRTLNVYHQGTKSVTLRIWDTAGQERFNSIITQFFRNVDGIVYVFDATELDSLEAVSKRWLPQINYWCPGVPSVLVANKIDAVTSKEEIILEKAKILAFEQKFDLIKCSAKTGENVRELFINLAEKIIKTIKVEEAYVSPTILWQEVLQQQESSSEIVTLKPKPNYHLFPSMSWCKS